MDSPFGIPVPNRAVDWEGTPPRNLENHHPLWYPQSTTFTDAFGVFFDADETPHQALDERAFVMRRSFGAEHRDGALGDEISGPVAWSVRHHATAAVEARAHFTRIDPSGGMAREALGFVRSRRLVKFVLTCREQLLLPPADVLA